MKALLSKISPYYSHLLALLGGAVMPLSLAPFYIATAAFGSILLLLFAIHKVSSKKAFLVGYLYGLAQFGVGVSWIYVSIHEFGNASAMLAGLLTALFVFTLALFPAFVTWLTVTFFKRHFYVKNILAFPAIWVLIEILRGWIFTGFPWLYLGYSQIETHLRALAPIGSVWLVSWGIIVIASLIFALVEYILQHRENKRILYSLCMSLIVVWAAIFSCSKITWVIPQTTALNVALVQGNIGQLLRWDEKYIQYITHTYLKLTYPVLHNDVIIWPEAAIPVPLPLAQPFINELNQLAIEKNSALIVGIPVELPDRKHYYNALIAVGDVEASNHHYYKERMVPFGEYVPFEPLLRGVIDFFDLPMSTMVPAPTKQSVIIAKGMRFAPAICYEIAYPILVRNMAKEADFILTVSNDAWFGKSIGPIQHLQIAQFRALEMGRYVLRATNTGYTAIIDPSGTIRAIAPIYQKTVLESPVFSMEGQTLWAKFGLWPLLVALLGCLILAYFIELRNK